MESILEFNHINYAYHTLEGETKALSDITFSVANGEFVAIVGPSGCVNSTIMSMICGLIVPDSGWINLNGKPLNDNPTSIGYMLQHDHLFEWRTVYHNVLLGLEIQHKLSNKTRQKAKKLLESYGLGAFADSRPSQLSGGMRQRAALVRTLVLDPDILLLDEPFSALDYQTRLTVGDDIGQILRNEKKTAILVTHDLSEAVSLADRVFVLTKRPATLKTCVPVTFNLTADTPMNRRNAPEFKHYFNLLWKELNHDE